MNFMNWAERAVVKKVCKAIPFNGHKVKDKVIDVVSKTIPDRFKNGVVYGAIKKGCKEVMVLDICNCLSGSRFLAKGKFYLIIFQSNFNNFLHCNKYIPRNIDTYHDIMFDFRFWTHPKKGQFDNSTKELISQMKPSSRPQLLSGQLSTWAK